MAQTAGWYRVDDDPEGTRRYWDGSKWATEPLAGEQTEPADGDSEDSTNSRWNPLTYFKAACDPDGIDGRASRAEFVCYTVGAILAVVFLRSIAQSSRNIAMVNGTTVMLSVLWGVVFRRRLHDLGYSGKWILTVFLGVGLLLIPIGAVMPGKPDANEWGPAPIYG